MDMKSKQDLLAALSECRLEEAIRCMGMDHECVISHGARWVLRANRPFS